MRVVRLLDILIAYILLFLFAAALVAGVFRWRFFIAAAVALALYFLWEFLRLRCPWCSSTVELSRLLRGARRTRSCHCPACGHEITVVFRINRSVPEHAARTKARAEAREAAKDERPDTPEVRREDVSEAAASVHIHASMRPSQGRELFDAQAEEGDDVHKPRSGVK